MSERSLGPQDIDFASAAAHYSGRTPYVPSFFPEVAKTFSLSKESFVIDLGCGTGELAIGLAPFCGSVLAIDKSSEMLSVRGSPPENVRFLLGNPNAEVVPISERADLVVMGRTVHYFEKEKLLSFLHSSAKRSSSVLVCGAAIHPSTPWLADYWNLRMQYRSRNDVLDAFGANVFAGTEWSPARQIMIVQTEQYTARDLLRHALSYSSTLEAILADKDRFEKSLNELLQPHYVSSDCVSAQIMSWGLEYFRVPHP